MVKEVIQFERRGGRCDGHLLFGIRSLKWNEIIRNNAQIPHESSVAQLVNVSGPRSQLDGPDPEYVPDVEEGFPDFRILRFESCEMVSNVPNHLDMGRKSEPE